jgi:hypothetical protein
LDRRPRHFSPIDRAVDEAAALERRASDGDHTCQHALGYVLLCTLFVLRALRGGEVLKR